MGYACTRAPEMSMVGLCAIAEEAPRKRPAHKAGRKITRAPRRVGSSEESKARPVSRAEVQLQPVAGQLAQFGRWNGKLGALDGEDERLIEKGVAARLGELALHDAAVGGDVDRDRGGQVHPFAL